MKHRAILDLQPGEFLQTGAVPEHVTDACVQISASYTRRSVSYRIAPIPYSVRLV